MDEPPDRRFATASALLSASLGLDLWTWLELGAVLACLLAILFTSLAEAAMLAVDKVRVRARVERGDHRARLVDRLTEDPRRLLATLVITMNVCIIAASGLATLLTVRLLGHEWVPLVSAGMIALIVVFCELTPKVYGRLQAERVAFALAPSVGALHALLSPLAAGLHALGHLVVRVFYLPLLGGRIIPTGPQFTEEEIKELVATGQEAGELEPEEREMIHSAITFADKIAREVMAPRTDMVCLEKGTTLEEAAEVSLRTGYSRLPVYEEDLDHIIGILYVRDLLDRLCRNEKDRPVETLVRPALVVPESKHIDELLSTMQAHRVHMAIVIDEYGGTAGLVTIEDLLEEIVGEIQDEYDVEEEPIVELADGSMRVDARLPIEEVGERLGVAFPPGDFDSLGGFILAELGRLPEPQESFRWGNLEFLIERMNGQRIQTVRIRVEPRSEEEAGSEE